MFPPQTIFFQIIKEGCLEEISLTFPLIDFLKGTRTFYKLAFLLKIGVYQEKLKQIIKDSLSLVV
jgi:hypothetical protein